MLMSYPVRHRRSRRRPLVAALAAAALAAGALTGCSGEDGPESSVEAFLKGWRSGDLHAVGFIDPTGARVPADEVAKEIRALSGELAATPPELSRVGDAKITADLATARIQVTWTLPGQLRWAYESPVRLRHGEDDRWQVIWEPSVVQEKLEKGDRLALRRDAAPRAGVLDNAGARSSRPGRWSGWACSPAR